MAAHATIPFSSSSTLQTLTHILSQPGDCQLCLVFLRLPFLAALLMLTRPLPPPCLGVRRGRPQRHHSSPGYSAPTPIHDSRLTRPLIQQAPSADLVPWYRTVGGDQGLAPLLQAEPCFPRTSTSTAPPLVPTAGCNSGSVARRLGYMAVATRTEAVAKKGCSINLVLT